MRGVRRLGMLAACGIMAVGCVDHTPTSPPRQPAFMISDAAHSAGRPHFFFLPPMVTATPTATGNFDATLTPEVQICLMAGSACQKTIADFLSIDGGWGDKVRVSIPDEWYYLNWNTRPYSLNPRSTYRIRVFVSGIELGFADLDVVNEGELLHNVNTNEYVPLLNGGILPIRFRIEEGVVARLEVTPPEATINVGETQQFAATMYDLHGNVVTGPTVTWSTSDQAVATVDQTGLATGTGAGSATIGASAAGVDGSALLTVLQPASQPGIVAMPLDASWSQGVATDVNDDGTVVGYMYPVAGGAGGRRAFRWDGGSVVDVLPTNGATWCEAWGIGNLGTIVGTCNFPGQGARGVTWTGGGNPIALPTPTSLIPLSTGRGIYEDGTFMRITGAVNRNYNYTCSYPPCTSVASNAAIWTSTTGAPPTANPTQLGWNGNANGASGGGLAINASGHAAGQRSSVVQYACGFQCFNLADVPHAFRYTTAALDLGVAYIYPYGLGQSAGLGINSADVVVGWVDNYRTTNTNATRHEAARWPGAAATRTGIPGVPGALVTASEAHDVNGLGWIVGFYGSTGFVWKNNANPAAVLDPLFPGKATSALAISELKSGALFIAGSGVTDQNRTVPVRWRLTAP